MQKIENSPSNQTFHDNKEQPLKNASITESANFDSTLERSERKQKI
jgi:hypothetical protein